MKDSEVLTVEQVGKTYDNGFVALREVNISLARGRALAVVGGSGSGKSTLLRCIAGLEMPDGGMIRIGGKTVYDGSRSIYLPPEQRGVSMMFQDYALWPHMSVRQNVGYPIRHSRSELRKRVDDVLELVGCAPLAEKRPAELSGGEQQRVALARALVGRPSLLLADEPFSNLDTVLRDRIRGDFLSMRKEVGFSLVHVTHDPREAMMLGDDLLVMHLSRVEDAGPPGRVYAYPRSVIAAQALGVVNKLYGTVKKRSVGKADTIEVAIDTPIGAIGGLGLRELAVGDPVNVLIRPTHIVVEPAGGKAKPRSDCFVGVLRYSSSLGDITAYSVVANNGEEIRAEQFHGPLLAPGTRVHVSFPLKDVWAIKDLAAV